MNLQITNEAARWYKQELNLTEGDHIRFFVRYGGCSTVQSGFSLGISAEEPVDIGAKSDIEGITFYIEEKDLWYLDDHDLLIEYQSDYDEPVFQYMQKG
ncbi:hypothetical protein BACCIP111895_03169 [Neobacillus rhizosphaerae]|uniref:Core domain-containing protein n=1 Tax=Neobacillus rhizosphaerae TaxID=2880965 RepID=A0ABM9ETK1_9BACI|nr:HesB/YadR/YfhF family protein [Neobacillus rhizosphaerae]CAH2715985.1 hypothetical protein BACCIP111895_03169 [Neobacillus rhizosphaerae]